MEVVTPYKWCSKPWEQMRSQMRGQLAIEAEGRGLNPESPALWELIRLHTWADGTILTSRWHMERGPEGPEGMSFTCTPLRDRISGIDLLHGWGSSSDHTFHSKNTDLDSHLAMPSPPVRLIHNRFPDSEPYTLDGGSGKSPEYFVTSSTSSPEQTGIHWC